MMIANPLCIFIGNIIAAISPPFIFINESFGVSNLTTILVALGGIWAYTYQMEKKHFFDNLMAFTKEFNSALYILSYGKKSSYFIVFTEFSLHHAAMLNFMHVKKGNRRSRFNNKWTEYENKCKEIRDYGKSSALGEDDEFPEDFMIAESPQELQRDKDNKKALECLIQDLLKTAKR